MKCCHLPNGLGCDLSSVCVCVYTINEGLKAFNVLAALATGGLGVSGLYYYRGRPICGCELDVHR